jgi:hypothetical protein
MGIQTKACGNVPRSEGNEEVGSRMLEVGSWKKKSQVLEFQNFISQSKRLAIRLSNGL